MKRSILPIFFVAVTLSGCASYQDLMQQAIPTPAKVQPAQPSKAQVPQAVLINQLLVSANMLANDVKDGKLNREQAADKLNATRLQIIGPNKVDDSVFAVYRQIAKDRDSGAIDQDLAQDKIIAALNVQQKKWKEQNQPAKYRPVFTNFLMKIYGLPYLQ